MSLFSFRHGSLVFFHDLHVEKRIVILCCGGVSLLLALCSPLSSAAECHLATPSGEFIKSSSDVQAVNDISVDCTTSYTISLDAGKWFSSTRQLKNQEGETIRYNVWTDVNGTNEWGDIGFGGTYAAPPVSGTPTESITTHKIFGSISIPSGTIPTGNYTDSVGITLSWPPYSDKEKKEYTLDLSYTAQQECTLDVSGITGFGTWPVGAEDLAGVTIGNVNVTCTSGIQYALGIDAGQHYNGHHRQLAGNGNLISYTLRTAANGSEWGDTGFTTLLVDYVETHPGTIVQSQGNGQTQHFSVWGDAAVAGVPAGQYADEVSFTIVW
jgi:spore coat protein U-like protein